MPGNLCLEEREESASTPMLPPLCLLVEKFWGTTHSGLLLFSLRETTFPRSAEESNYEPAETVSRHSCETARRLHRLANNNPAYAHAGRIEAEDRGNANAGG